MYLNNSHVALHKNLNKMASLKRRMKAIRNNPEKRTEYDQLRVDLTKLEDSTREVSNKLRGTLKRKGL
jgi:hypothetical protein